MESYLIVVSRNRPELLQELSRKYARAEEVEIILDRRQQCRWVRPFERAEDRSASPEDLKLRSQGYVVIPRP